NGAVAALPGELLDGDARVEEGDDAVGADAAEGIAAVRAGAAGEEGAEVDELGVARVGQGAFERVAVVERKKKAQGTADGEGHVARDGDIGAKLGLDANVARVAAEWAAGE